MILISQKPSQWKYLNNVEVIRLWRLNWKKDTFLSTWLCSLSFHLTNLLKDSVQAENWKAFQCHLWAELSPRLNAFLFTLEQNAFWLKWARNVHIVSKTVHYGNLSFRKQALGGPCFEATSDYSLSSLRSSLDWGLLKLRKNHPGTDYYKQILYSYSKHTKKHNNIGFTIKPHTQRMWTTLLITYMPIIPCTDCC